MELNDAKRSPFECGFSPIGRARSPFRVQYFLLAVLFLIFDVEVCLFVPVLKYLWRGGILVSVGVRIMFRLILLLGLVYEFRCGALDWA